jgi:hypothetical protein
MNYRYGNSHNGSLNRTLVSSVTNQLKPPDSSARPHFDSRGRQNGGNRHDGSEHPGRWSVGWFGELVAGVGEARGAAAGVGW